MNIALPEGSELYADSGYTDYETEDLYQEIENIKLQVCRRKNSKRQDETWLSYMKTKMRKKIESVFACITRLFPNKIHAVTPQGFILKIVIFLLSYSMNKAIQMYRNLR